MRKKLWSRNFNVQRLEKFLLFISFFTYQFMRTVATCATYFCLLAGKLAELTEFFILRPRDVVSKIIDFIFVPTFCFPLRQVPYIFLSTLYRIFVLNFFCYLFLLIILFYYFFFRFFSLCKDSNLKLISLKNYYSF